ncbi:hypothetical protein [Streptomyces roseolus]|uniref:hypothetical protein n=1 Tax=Streptomyces roseolus TaxID=67358 RepID=UPI001676D03E|nr:hypothetical protein [Streptomyces roseolus]GGR13954.1 hypothetical protein GCM10010282_02920 [Streptomyces roseolus]
MPRFRSAWSPVVLSALVVALCSVGVVKSGTGQGTSGSAAGPAAGGSDTDAALSLDLGWD